MFKKLLSYTIVFSLVFNNLAFATQSIIELDFKDSQTPQRLHVIPRMSNVGDVSHLEIDAEQKQAAVYLKEKQEEALDEVEKNSSQGGEVPVTTKPVILQKNDIINLPWELEPEKLTLFILNHTAWLSPLDEDAYRLEFRGGLLGGMKAWGNQYCGVQPDGNGGFELNVPVVKNVGFSGGGGNNNGGGILGQGWAEIKANGDKARDRMRQQQENLKKLNTANQPWEIYKRPEIIIPESPFPRVQPYQPSTKESFQTGASLEDQYSRLRVLYNMADRWEWWEIYEYAKVIGVSREEIKKYNLTQRHAKKAGFSWEYFKEVTEEEERNALKKKQQEEEEREKARQYERDSSLAGSSLFKNVPPQYQVTPEYFEQSASDAGLMPSEALHIILNPTSENFYHRTILTSRQKWLGGADNTIAFIFEDLTNKQAYKYLSQGYKFGDFPTLSDRLVSQNGASLFENVKPEDFLKQAEKANMTSIQALGILVNPTPENFYNRIILTSRQSWLGGAENTTVFGFEGLTNEQAYKYIADGYKPQDFPTLSDRLVSQNGATLFENTTPDYFATQAKNAGMTSIQALGILVNPTPENFYDRIILTSRQNWMGGTQDTTAFLLEGLTNEQAYKYLSQGYHKGDTATLSNKLISERWDIDTGNPFDDQELEDWGVKDERELFIQVKGLKDYDPRRMLLKKLAESDMAKNGINKLKDIVKKRIINPPKAESPVWREFKPYRGDIKTNGEIGKNKKYYKWDKLHNEIEMHDHLGNPIDALDPITGERLFKDVSKHKPLDL